MGKRYTVSHNVALQQQNDPNSLVYNEQVDLAVLLSQRLQRNVRQGHVFKVHKLSLGLTPAGGDLDTGMAVSGSIRWAPATKNSVKAWQIAFNTWRKQKSLILGAVGQGVRYDDFEIAYDYGEVNARTSRLFTTGMNDSGSEAVVIYGDSTPSQDVSLRDMYESLQPQAEPSRFPLSNGIVKPSKFTDEFPNAQVHHYGANWSTVIAAGVAEPDSGASYNSDPIYFEDKNCLAGVVVVNGYVLAEDAPGGIEDELTLTLSMTVEISTPLVSRKPKSKRTKRKGGAKRGKSSRTRRSRK